MKGIALSLLCAVALATSARIRHTNSCPMDVSVHHLIPHENCNQYYQCVYGEYQALTCPHNLMYNPRFQVCDWAQNVDCGERLLPKQVSEDKEGSENNDDNSNAVHIMCSGQDSANRIMEHDTCNKFYICSGGFPIVVTCPDYLLYNPELQVCDWPQNVVCRNQHLPHEDDLTVNSGIPTEKEDEPNEEAIATCTADESEGVFVKHERCDKFYLCTGGVPVAQPCPDGLLFNEILNVCDWRLNVVCGDRIL